MIKKIIMAIAGSDSSGGAGIQADIKTITAHSCYPVTIITSITSQNTTGVYEIHDLPVDVIKSQFKAIIDDIRVDAVKTGMLSTPEIVKAVSEKLEDLDAPLIVDPVMVAETGVKLQKKDAADYLKKHLIPIAKTVTPNIHEAEVLSGVRIKTIEDAIKSAERIHSLGCETVVITGGHFEGRDVAFDGEAVKIFEGELLDIKSHGSGCSFASAVACNLAMGVDFFESVKRAKEFIEISLKSSYKIGHGVVPVNQMGVVEREIERYRVLRELQNAVDDFLNLKRWEELIPEVGTNLAYSIPFPRNMEDVAGIEGRIRRRGPVGCVKFGASDHLARLILNAVKFDPDLRAVINIRYDDNFIEAMRRCGLEIFEIKRTEDSEKRERRTMQWIIEESYRKLGKMPDVIFDRGFPGKEAMIRVFGRTPDDVLQKIKKTLKILYE